MAYLSPRDEELMNLLSFDQRATILATAYTTYVELTPSNRKPQSQREFLARYRNNWDGFAKIEDESRTDE